MTSTCRHCGERIVLVNWSMGPGWTHQPAGASFQDGMHVYCHVTRAAEPEPEPAADAALIADARTSLPLALDALEAVLATLPPVGAEKFGRDFEAGVAKGWQLARAAIDTALRGDS